jgi:hypothetical protein
MISWRKTTARYMASTPTTSTGTLHQPSGNRASAATDAHPAAADAVMSTQ